MPDTWAKHGARLDRLETKVGDSALKIIEHEERLKLHGTRLTSYADAELAYRRAKDELQSIQEGNSDAYKKMLDAAKTQLSASVETAMSKLREPLSVVADIREAQHKRHAREEVLAEDDALAKARKSDDDKSRAESREFFIKMAVAGGALAASVGTAISAYFAMRGH